MHKKGGDCHRKKRVSPNNKRRIYKDIGNTTNNNIINSSTY